VIGVWRLLIGTAGRRGCTNRKLRLVKEDVLSPCPEEQGDETDFAPQALGQTADTLQDVKINRRSP